MVNLNFQLPFSVRRSSPLSFVETEKVYAEGRRDDEKVDGNGGERNISPRMQSQIELRSGAKTTMLVAKLICVVRY